MVGRRSAGAWPPGSRSPRFGLASGTRDATIAHMAKFRPSKGKKAKTAAPQAGLPCVIILIGGMLLVMLFLYFVMRNANG